MTDHDIDILARTLYGEARGEYAKVGLSAFIAIANVVMNRLKGPVKFGQTIAEVCLKPKQFSCWNRKDPNYSLITQEGLEKDPLFKLTKTVAKKVTLNFWPDVTGESDHYHATSCKPYWARASKIKVRLGRHIFYKLD